MRHFDFTQLAKVNVHALLCSARIRQQPDHFQVTEQLPFEPDGEGGHVMLQIEKTNTNTDWLAKQLALFAGVNDVEVGYAGLKDRHAVTTQWFTIKTEGIQEPDWSEFTHPDWQIKTVTRHKKKLKRGVLSGNHFRLCLTALDGEHAQWISALEAVRDHGVPNYFAEQRFGHNNLQKVSHWFASGTKPKKRQQRSLYLSSARSWLFNLVLSERIKQHNWNQAIDGDVMQLSGNHSIFAVADVNAEIQQRLAAFDIHPTGPLWGRGKQLTSMDCHILEATTLESWHDWLQALEQQGLGQERRALRLVPQNLEWQFEANAVWLSFYLPAGSYATAVLRELAEITDASVTHTIAGDS